MNLFWAAVRNVTALRRFESMHRFKTLPCAAKSAAGFDERGVDFPVSPGESFSLREIRHAVHVRTFAAPAVLRPARFKIRGGRANRRRCARWRRFPSDCRVRPRSSMRIVVLCRNFSGGGLLSRSFQTREIRTSHPQAPKAKHVRGLERTG
jgi:hypothetical protein